MLAIRAPFAALGGARAQRRALFRSRPTRERAVRDRRRSSLTRLFSRRSSHRAPKRPFNRRAIRRSNATPPEFPSPACRASDDRDVRGSSHFRYTRPTVDPRPPSAAVGFAASTATSFRSSAAPRVSAARAHSGNIEGWVQVRFTVTASAGSRRRRRRFGAGHGFDDAALKAIARWRYNPRVENGEAVERVGLQTIIRFELEN